MDTQKLRQRLDTTLESIPEGPLGRMGRGQAFGAFNYFTVATVNGLIPVAGTRVGFKIRSHNVEQVEDGELHRYEIIASNKRVAEFTARFRSPPTNIDFFRSNPTVESSELAKERDTLNLYRVVVLYPEEEGSRGFRDADMDILT